MERIVDRARAAMNLVLIVSLLAAWAVFDTGPDIMVLADRIKADTEAIQSNIGFFNAPSQKWIDVHYYYMRDSAENFLTTAANDGLGETPLEVAISMSADILVFSGLGTPLTISAAGFSTQKRIEEIHAQVQYEKHLTKLVKIQLAKSIGDQSPDEQQQPTSESLALFSELYRASLDAEKGDQSPDEQQRPTLGSLDQQASLTEYLKNRARFDAKKLNLATNLNKLEQIIDEWKIAPNQTFESAQSALTGSIKIPILEQEIASRSAPMIVLFALVAPLLYLVSICQTIERRGGRASVTEETGGFDWIFLHESQIGPILGTGWLLLPVGAIIVGIYQGVFDILKSVLLLSACGGVSGYAIVRAWRLRDIYYPKAA